MKRIVVTILFLLAIVWGWNTAGEYRVPVDVSCQTEQTAPDQATPYIDGIIQVLAEANHYADVSLQTNTIPTNVTRRYRPAGFSFDKLFEYQTEDQNSSADHIFKSFLEFSQYCAARLKDTGYYIYTLRKIII